MKKEKDYRKRRVICCLIWQKTGKTFLHLEPVFKIVASQYPDIAHYHINAYSLNEILAEKIRSILQRGKSRDYYDVWTLLKVEKFDLKKIRELLMGKCKLKGIEFKLESIFDEDKLRDTSRF